jgi:peroxiredoxin (alkyl hydroperoxide reductase subunit C)
MLELDQPAPEFVADSNTGKIALSNFLGKWVVLFAYPADFTPICELDIIGFARSKTVFDSLGVQFIGWSLNTTDSHERWIREIKERTGVGIDYPLIADVDKKLAERYGILHKTRDVAYRAVFIIDPDGILKFSAIYPLDVGRSVKEVERIIKVLQRARELTHLDDFDRARKLSMYDAPSFTEAAAAEGLDPVEDATKIVLVGEEEGVTLRLIGGLAIRMHCHGKHSAHLRAYHDIDVFGLSKERKGIESVFKKLEYSPNVEFNARLSSDRMQFTKSGSGKNVDVFLDKFRMQHTLDLRRRIRLDDLTIPITGLLLTKLQMGIKLEAKDAQDIVAILEDHELGRSEDKETLNLDYMADLCSRDWGLYQTLTNGLEKIRQIIEDDLAVQCTGMEASEMVRKLDVIQDSLVSRKKSVRWKARSLMGERMKWYEEVQLGEFEQDQ